MPLTPAQIAQVSAALPGWVWQQDDCRDTWEDDDLCRVKLCHWHTGEIEIAVEGEFPPSEAQETIRLLEQAAAAAALLEQFEQEGKT